LLTQLVARHRPKLGGYNECSVRTAAAALVSSIRDTTMVIVHDGTTWNFATTS